MSLTPVVLSARPTSKRTASGLVGREPMLVLITGNVGDGFPGLEAVQLSDHAGEATLLNLISQLDEVPH